MTVVVDDHLLGDWMARRDDALIRALAGEPIATTNLWYARLCKSAAAIDLDGRLLVSERDDGPGIRRCSADVGIRYDTLSR